MDTNPRQAIQRLNEVEEWSTRIKFLDRNTIPGQADARQSILLLCKVVGVEQITLKISGTGQRIRNDVIESDHCAAGHSHDLGGCESGGRKTGCTKGGGGNYR